MGSIRLELTDKNKAFADKVALATGARVEMVSEGVLELSGMDGEDLVIPRYCYDMIFGENGDGWRRIALNREGRARINQKEIVVGLERVKRPAMLLEFDEVEERERINEFAERWGWESARKFVLDAVGKEMERLEGV